MMHGGGMMDGWGMMAPMMWVFMLMLWIFAVIGLIFAVRWLVGRHKAGDDKASRETPLDVIKMRYARGEIDRKDFEQMKKDLE